MSNKYLTILGVSLFSMLMAGVALAQVCDQYKPGPTVCVKEHEVVQFSGQPAAGEEDKKIVFVRAGLSDDGKDEWLKKDSVINCTLTNKGATAINFIYDDSENADASGMTDRGTLDPNQESEKTIFTTNKKMPKVGVEHGGTQIGGYNVWHKNEGDNSAITVSVNCSR